MADPAIRDRSDQRLQQVLSATGAADPRDRFRPWLRRLRERDADAFARATAHYETRLLPAVAAEGSDPLAEWVGYGVLLAALLTPGRAAQVDGSGRAHRFAPPAPAEHLVLHLPDSGGEPPMLIAVPATLTRAQRATVDLLVGGAQALSEPGTERSLQEKAGA